MIVEIRLLRDVAHAPLIGDPIILNGLALKQDVAVGHLDEASDHLHGCRLAGTVGSKVAGDLTGPRGKAHVIHRSDSGEMFGDTAYLKHGSPAWRSNRGERKCSLLKGR